MQDFQSISDLARHLLGSSATAAAAGGGSGVAELRRLRGYDGLPPAAAAQQPPVKCPRCDSTNTKFCYYNNYNLSQPRHFCKACRRYWTKGGVLRNVPVGGGCRKSKRSSTPSSKASSKSSPSASAVKGSGQQRLPSSASRSSSDSSSLTAGVPTTTATDVSTSDPFAESIFLAHQTTSSSLHPNSNTLFDALVAVGAPLCSAPEIYQEASAGGLTNLMTTATVTATTPELLGFGFLDASSFQYPGSHQQKMPEEFRVQPPPQHGFTEQLFNMDPAMIGGAAGGLAAVDWPGAVVEPAIFDLAGAVDPVAYWSQSHWGDTDPSLYLP